MKVGFLNNQMDNRGTGNAMFDYAHYNEVMLGNESRIYTFPYTNHDDLAVERYTKRFGQIQHHWDIPADSLDVLYHIKSGFDDNFRAPEDVPYAVHAVFDYQPHGDRYAMVSSWLAERNGAKHVPHIVSLPKTDKNLRDFLHIPKDAIVFGRYGGADTFDIPFVWNAIGHALTTGRIWFLFMNTDIPSWMRPHPRIQVAEPTANPEHKAMFINTCDAMLHARQRGETFGIAVGEFAQAGKPVLTYRDSPEQAHFEELPYAEKYSTEEELIELLTQFEPYRMDGYKEFTPENVMRKFKEVFLD